MRPFRAALLTRAWKSASRRIPGSLRDGRRSEGSPGTRFDLQPRFQFIRISQARRSGPLMHNELPNEKCVVTVHAARLIKEGGT